MRKILTSVLSVAGLLAVVLALATSPASAAKDVVTITTPLPAEGQNVGTYTVSWETRGSCDPGSGTSGASGSVTLTVVDTGTSPELRRDGVGLPEETGVVIDTDCVYDWEAGFVGANGAACRITELSQSPTVADATVINLVLEEILDANVCVTMGNLVVTVRATGIDASTTCTFGAGRSAPDNTCGDATGLAATPPDTVTPVKSTQTARDLGAVKNTVFTVTATPEKDSRGDIATECTAASTDTKANAADDQAVTLRVTDAALDGTPCMYTVTAAIPVGFVAGDGSKGQAKFNSEEKQDPNDQDNPGGEPTPTVATDDTYTTVPVLTVSVGTVIVYLVQDLVGDAGGASVSYTGLSASCGGPDGLNLPADLMAERSGPSSSSGIYTIPGSTLVELRTGRYNITQAIHVDFDGITAWILDDEGETCTASANISGVPGHCSDSSNVPLDLVEAGDAALVEFTIDCSVPVEPEAPVVPEAPVDTGAGDMDDGDAGDMDDGDAGDMTGGTDDTDSGTDDTDDGPIMDTPTG